MQTFKESFLILLFEFLGTLLLASLWNTCLLSGGSASSFLVGFFILLIFSARISGSHFNPAITLAFMFRKDVGRFSRLLGLLYIAAQYGGAFLGSQLSYNIFGIDAITEIDGQKIATIIPCAVLKGGEYGQTSLVVPAMVFETMGALLLTFLYLTQTEEKTKLSGDPAITTLIISATYTTLLAYSVGSRVISGSPFNPAISMGEFWAVLFGGAYERGNGLNLWVTMIFPYAGAILAVILFEFGYKNAMNSVEEAEQVTSEDEDAEDKLLQGATAE
jgi:glycerol uptake facilitator-like aquaporin